jgi:hypothetical protein
MVNKRQLVNLVHIIFAGPLLIYIGYNKINTHKNIFDFVLIIGIVVILYHLYLLNRYRSIKYI